MMRRNHPHTAITTISLSLLLAIALPTGAAADDAAKRDGPTPPSTRLASTAEPAAPDPGSGATTSTTATTGDAAAPAARYPRSVIARPLTLPAGLAMLGADASANHDFSSMGGAPIVGYGFTDDIEIQIPYAFATKDFEIKGTLNADIGYKLLRGAADGKLEAIARVRGGYNLLDSAAAPLMLGVHVQYNITDTIAVISGTPGSQQLRISLADDAAMTRPIDLSLPLGVGYQPTEQFYLQLDTKLVQLDLKDSANVAIFADATPVALTLVYNALPALDVQAVLSTDLTNSPGDALSFLIGARYYAGKL
ncbi:MAG TPA: hypothetical protein VFD36_18130 [Kofleriaceae bacterium]|nr:hypothetical protein [Kofleriaceae bacterium]